jgi:hypothetical protein
MEIVNLHIMSLVQNNLSQLVEKLRLCSSARQLFVELMDSESPSLLYENKKARVYMGLTQKI